MERLIRDIKNDFRSEISLNDPKIKKLRKLSGELFTLTNQTQLFEKSQKEKAAWNKQVQKLTSETKKLEAEIEEIKNNKIYENAFEWRFEFPEVLDDEGKFVGFDVVIGNPPYVQLQKMGTESDALEKQNFETFTKTGDIYQLFYEIGINLLTNRGFLCFITSNKWMRTDYGKTTRNYLGTKCNVQFVVDFGMGQMFDSATTYTNILLLAKQQPSATISLCRVKNDYKLEIPLEEYVLNNLVEVENPQSNSWVVYDKNEYKLIKRIEAMGIPLKSWDIQINRGILTGFNEAFVINTETRDRLVKEDSKSSEIIKPILRGEDIKAYVPQWKDRWIIATFPALKLNIEDYPAVKKYLLNYKDRLEPKPKGYDGKWKGRKSGSYKWFEIQDAISYHAEFNKPKIIYPNMTKYLPFVYDKGSFFTNQKCFIITGHHLSYLTAFLNSKLFRFAFRECFPELLGDTRELSKIFFENVRVKPIDDLQNNIFSNLVNRIAVLKKRGEDFIALEEEIEKHLSTIYSLSAEDRKLIDNGIRS